MYVKRERKKKEA